MEARCENCRQMKELPAYLWSQVIYKLGFGLEYSRTVCPACAEWARQHPSIAQLLPH